MKNPWANLSPAEREALIQGLQATFGGKAAHKRSGRGGAVAISSE